MTITDDTIAIADDLRRAIGQALDTEQRALVAAWARAWDLVAEQWQTAVDDIAATVAAGRAPTQTEILNLTRARNALAATIEQIDQVAADMGIRLNTTAVDVVTRTATAEAEMIASQWPVQVNAARFDRVNPQALDAIVQRTTTQITAGSRDLAPDAYRRVMVELTRAIPAGLSPRDAAARMLGGVESSFNGGLPRALTIARTEILDAYRAAAYQQHTANDDVLAGWVWTAKLDLDTCPACIAMHGTVHPLTEQGPLGHPNCRCARTPKTRSWAELGFDGMTEPADLIGTGEEWFWGLGEPDQLAIMGGARLDALRSGVPFADLATLRHNPGWRDSITPTSVAQLAS